jgi:hypothetical protein
VFFRSLLLRSKEVIEVARTSNHPPHRLKRSSFWVVIGLKQVIEREKLPKDLLQQCLRPVLLNLADHR